MKKSLILSTLLMSFSGTTMGDTGDLLSTLIPSVGNSSDNFGWSVAIDGNTVVVGSPRMEGLPSGLDDSAFSFDITLPTNPVELAHYSVPPSSDMPFFGIAVGVFGDTVVVGSMSGNEPVNGPKPAISFYSTSSSNLIHRLFDDQFGSQFGSAISYNGGSVMVGAPWRNVYGGPADGAFHIIDPVTYANVRTDAPSDYSAGEDEFAFAVSLSDSYRAAGNPYFWENGSYRGSVEVYGSAGEQFRIQSAAGSFGDEFGHSVAVSNSSPDAVLIGAPGVDTNGFASGGAYLYTPSTDNLALLSPAVISAGDNFGHAVALTGNYAIVGAPREDSVSTNSGAVYIFDINTGLEVAQISGFAANSYFGASVAVSGSKLVVGAPGFILGEGTVFSAAGRAYVFDLRCNAADFAVPYGSLNSFDTSAFFGAYTAGDSAADMDGNGTHNFLDISIFLSLMSAGCP